MKRAGKRSRNVSYKNGIGYHAGAANDKVAVNPIHENFSFGGCGARLAQSFHQCSEVFIELIGFERNLADLYMDIGGLIQAEFDAAGFGFGVFLVTTAPEAEVVGADHGVGETGYRKIVSGEGDAVVKVVVENDVATIGEPLTEYGERTHRLAVVGNVD